jgi:hypothetical protein
MREIVQAAGVVEVWRTAAYSSRNSGRSRKRKNLLSRLGGSAMSRRPKPVSTSTRPRSRKRDARASGASLARPAHRFRGFR